LSNGCDPLPGTCAGDVADALSMPGPFYPGGELCTR
jgi:hypothetical protein